MNGNAVTLDVPAMTMDGRTLVPLRFLGEALGGRVHWDGDRQTVEIRTERDGYGQNDARTGSAPTMPQMRIAATERQVERRPGDGPAAKSSYAK